MRPARLRAAFAAAILAVAVTPVAAQARHHDSLGEKTSKQLRAAIKDDRMFKHLEALATIATENGGNRASGFQGYGASAQYILTELRNAGYRPTVQTFNFVTFEELSAPVLKQLTPTAKTYTHPGEFLTMSYSASGDTGAQAIVPVDVNLDPVPANRLSTSGCEDADFAGFPAGAIALMQRGTCGFADKVVNAQEAGASGAIVFNQGNDPGRSGVVAGTLAETAQDGDPAVPDVTIPAVGISYAEGERLANETSPTGQVVVDAKSDRRVSSNILADTRSGNPDNVTIVGSHLDSVPEGPGINDNGSGSAFNLELARQISKLRIRPVNRIRFAFWGAEESGLVGATRYVAAISDEDFAKIAANLNFDMLASPNHANFVYDGDFSDTPPPATAPAVNPGAAKIEQDFVRYFTSKRVATEPSGFDGRSDYKPFQDNGIAAGGLFSGAEVAKTAAQVEKWGGTAGVAFDPCYHQACDDIDNLDLDGYETLADGGAHVLATLAQDRNLRATLAAGPTAAAAKKSAKARKAARAKARAKARKTARKWGARSLLAEYRGDKLVR